MAGSTRDTWDRAAPGYDIERAEDSIYNAAVKAACSAIERANPARVLDAGCGTGLTTIPLCRPDRLVVGSDYSHVSLRILLQKQTTARLAQVDVCALPYPDRSFDAVLCANTLQHLTPAWHHVAIDELCRVLVPGGRWCSPYITTPGPNSAPDGSRRGVLGNPESTTSFDSSPTTSDVCYRPLKYTRSA